MGRTFGPPHDRSRNQLILEEVLAQLPSFTRPNEIHDPGFQWAADGSRVWEDDLRAEMLHDANPQSAAFDRATVGRRFDVLLERAGRHAGQKVGRSPYLQAVHLSAPDLPLGALVRVVATAAGANSLAASRLDRPDRGPLQAMEAVA